MCVSGRISQVFSSKTHSEKEICYFSREKYKGKDKETNEVVMFFEEESSPNWRTFNVTYAGQPRTLHFYRLVPHSLCT